jgi:hypothetical protein
MVVRRSLSASGMVRTGTVACGDDGFVNMFEVDASPLLTVRASLSPIAMGIGLPFNCRIGYGRYCTSIIALLSKAFFLFVVHIVYLDTPNIRRSVSTK